MRPPLRKGVAVSGAGLLLLFPCALVARNGRVGPAEESVFRALNELPEWLYRPLWVFQQFGNIVVAALVVVGLAVLLRNTRLAIAAVTGVVAKLVLERVVKMLVERERPGSTAPRVITSPTLVPGRWRAVPWVVVALNGLGRIYVGAHNPLDIVGGIGLGMVIGGGLYALVAWSEVEVEGHR